MPVYIHGVTLCVGAINWRSNAHQCSFIAVTPQNVVYS